MGLVKGILALFLILSTTVQGFEEKLDLEWELEYSYNIVDHSWKAVGTDKANWSVSTRGLGVTAWKGNWGAKVMYTRRVADATTEGQYADWNLIYKPTKGLEVKYRKELYNNLYGFVGIGTWWQPLPIYRPDGSLSKNDRDDDEGWFYGVTYYIQDDWGVTYQFTEQSRITVEEVSLDEWIRVNSLQIFYRF